MKNNLWFIFFLSFLFSCCGKGNKEKPILEEEYAECTEYDRSEPEAIADSAWYFALTEAWEKRDTVGIYPFFEAWHRHTIEHDHTPNIAYKSLIDTIINTIRIHNNSYPKEYAVFPSKIYYSVIDTLTTSFKLERRHAYYYNLDTMYFQPDGELLGRKVIMDADPYRWQLDAFLNQDEVSGLSGKYRFIKYYIKGGFSKYIDEPNIRIIILNKELDTAYMEYIYMESLMGARLIRKDGEWIIISNETLRIA